MPSRGGAPECLALRHRRSHWRLPGGLLALVPGGSVPPHPTSRTEPLSARYRGLRTSSWTPFSAALGSCCLPRNATKVAFSPHIRQILLRLYSFLLPPLSPEDNGRTQSSFSRTQEHLNLFSPSCGKLQKKKNQSQVPVIQKLTSCDMIVCASHREGGPSLPMSLSSVSCMTHFGQGNTSKGGARRS